MIRAITLILSFLIAVNAWAQPAQGVIDLSNYGVRIEPDKRLILVLITLEMARASGADGKDVKLINTPLSEQGARFREQLAAEYAGLNADLRRRISVFVTQYKKRNPTATDAQIVAPFISMAYTLSPAPELADPAITTDLPGNLLDVLDFAPLVREFYRRSGISARLDDHLKDYRAEADGILRASAREMVSDVLGYLHTRPRLAIVERVKVEAPKSKSKSTALQKTELRTHERRFVLVPEKLVPKGDVIFLNIRDDYYAIVPPDTDLNVSDARRAFLRFVVDPLVFDHAKDAGAIREWARPLLVERRKIDPSVSPDVVLAISRSLVAAIDVRQNEYARVRAATEQARQRIGNMKTEAEKRAVSADLERFSQLVADESALRLYEEYEKGAVLAFYFAEQLKGIEESGFDIASSLRDMILSFDGVKETARVAASVEPRKRALAAREERRKAGETGVVVTENPVTVHLIEIQKSVDARNYQKATADLKQLLAQFPGEPRIYYNLGRVAALTAAGIEDAEAQGEKLLEAKNAYTAVLNSATATTDKALISLTYVALGRIYEFFDEKSIAIQLYDRAIALSDVTGGGYREALAAKQRLIKPQ
jgi:tetratricopeptide (TPR) repeat protein